MEGLLEDLERLAAAPTESIPADARNLLRSVCDHLNFPSGLFARFDGNSIDVETVFPSSHGWTPAETQHMEGWLGTLTIPTSGTQLFEEIDLDGLGGHPICIRAKCSTFITVPVTNQGSLLGLFGFFHRETPDTWSPFAESIIGIMTGWFVQRILSEAKGDRFSLLPEAELQQNAGVKATELFRSTTQQLVYIMDDSGKLCELNRGAMKFEDLSPSAFRGRHLWELPSVKHLQAGKATLQAMVEEVKRQRTSHRTLKYRFGKSVRQFQFSLRQVNHPTLKESMLLGESIEVTEHFRVMDLESDQHLIFKEIFNRSNHFIGLCETDGTILHANDTALEFIGARHKEIFGKKLWNSPWFFKAQGEQLQEAVKQVANGESIKAEILIRGKGGVLLPIEFTLKPLRNPRTGDIRYLLPEGHDLSKLKDEALARMDCEREVLDHMKDESLSILAGGVAHKFSNLLTGILGNTELLLLDVPDGSESSAMLKEIQQAAMTSSDLCRQMSAYSGKGQLAIGLYNLSDLILSWAAGIREVTGESSSLRFDLAPHLPGVRMDPDQIRLLILSLIRNAHEATEKPGGEIVLRTYLSLGGDESVTLDIVDHGIGMDEQTRDRAFEPFFTTKFTGRGLGLSAVAGIVAGHSGEIELQSKPDQGTRVSIRLPAHTQVSRPATPSKPLAEPPKLVLVVDDEKVVRHVVARLLKRIGLDCVQAQDGLEAIARVTIQSPPFDLVLLDINMPGIDGLETFKRLATIQPGIPVIMMSAYTGTEEMLDFAEDNRVAFLPKPLAPAAFEQSVREALHLPKD